MRFWNQDEIATIVRRASATDSLAPYATVLERFVSMVQSNSDGWGYWLPACTAAEGLILLLDRWSRTPSAIPAHPEPELNRATGRLRALCTKHHLQDPTGLDNAGIAALLDALVLAATRERGITIRYTLHPAPAPGSAGVSSLPSSCSPDVLQATTALLQIERYDAGALRGAVAVSRPIEATAHAALAAHRRLRDWAGRDARKRAVLALVLDPSPV